MHITCIIDIIIMSTFPVPMTSALDTSQVTEQCNLLSDHYCLWCIVTGTVAENCA